MKQTGILSIVIASLFFASCKPKPLDIKIDRKNQQLAIASVALDNHSVLIFAGYTINSLTDLLDTSKVRKAPESMKGLVVDSGLVVITSPNQKMDTLVKISPGLYRTNRLQLMSDADYTLFIKDLKTGKQCLATTRFNAVYHADTLLPIVERRTKDTLVKLRACISNVKSTDHFFIHYTSPSATKTSVNPWSFSTSALQTFSPKTIELLSGKDAVNGKIAKFIVLNAKGHDTLLLQFSKIDEAYFNYLAAYKRSGNLLSQITGEPVNLPTNLSSGVGFFSLYIAERKLFDLKKH